jgi:hypothetical protein
MQLFFALRLVTFSIFLSTDCTSLILVTNEVSASGIGKPGIITRSAFPVVVEVPVLVTVQEQVLSFLHEKIKNATAIRIK